jgi:hypothetical protein
VPTELIPLTVLGGVGLALLGGDLAPVGTALRWFAGFVGLGDGPRGGMLATVVTFGHAARAEPATAWGVLLLGFVVTCLLPVPSGAPWRIAVALKGGPLLGKRSFVMAGLVIAVVLAGGLVLVRSLVLDAWWLLG